MGAVSNEVIVSALITSPTIKAAAKKAGVTERTIYDKMKERNFEALYSAAKSDILRNAIHRLNELQTQSIDVFRDIMLDHSAPAAVRLQAAKTAIDYAESFSIRLSDNERKVKELMMDRKEKMLDFDW